MAFPFLQSLQDEAQRFGALLKKRRAADTRLDDATQPISSLRGFKENSSRLKIPSIARHGNRPNAPIAVKAPEARIRICPVCETLVQPTPPDIENPPEAPAIEYKLIAQVRGEEERHDWSTCALYNLVADQELALTDSKTQQHANYRGHTCCITQLGGSFELCCEPGKLNSSSNDCGVLGLPLTSTNCITDCPEDEQIRRWVLPPDPLSPSSLQMVRGWIDDCGRNHVRCKPCKVPDAQLPTRILDVQDTSIRLVRTPGQFQDYIALSHCWGTGERLTTTTGTIEARKLGFGIEELPATFRDAVTLTRILGLRYLWIDSLCIIQDDASDWRKEGSRMGDVYANASLTICASSALNDSDGFLQHRPYRYQPVTLISPSGARTEIFLRCFSTFMNGLGGRPPNPEDEPLTSRAWTFQERFLSRKKLSFCGAEMFWECREHCQYETRSWPGRNELWQEYSVDKLLPAEVVGRVAFNGWREAVTRYSKRRLTYESDKLPALAGLAAFVAKGAGSRYCAGLWYDDLPQALLWTCQGQRLEAWRAPSWSWASTDGWVSSEPFHHHSSLWRRLECVSIKEVHTATAEENPYGAVTAAWLKLKAPVLPTFRRTRSSSARLLPRDMLSNGPQVWSLLPNLRGFRVWPKLDVYGEGNGIHFAIPLMIESSDSGSVDENQIHGLLVQETSDSESSYHRTGTFTSDKLRQSEIHDFLGSKHLEDILLV